MTRMDRMTRMERVRQSWAMRPCWICRERGCCAHRELAVELALVDAEISAEILRSRPPARETFYPARKQA